MDPEVKALLLGRERYPGLTLEQSELAREWVLKHADEFDGMLFNAQIGGKLIHLVAMKGTEVTLVEVPPWLSMASAVLLGCAKEWKLRNPDTTAVHLVALGRDVSMSTLALLRARYISVELFPRPLEAPAPPG